MAPAPLLLDVNASEWLQGLLAQLLVFLKEIRSPSSYQE